MSNGVFAIAAPDWKTLAKTRPGKQSFVIPGRAERCEPGIQNNLLGRHARFYARHHVRCPGHRGRKHAVLRTAMPGPDSGEAHKMGPCLRPGTAGRLIEFSIRKEKIGLGKF